MPQMLGFYHGKPELPRLLSTEAQAFDASSLYVSDNDYGKHL